MDLAIYCPLIYAHNVLTLLNEIAIIGKWVN